MRAAPGDESGTDRPSGTALAPFVVYLTMFFMVWSIRATVGYAVDIRIPTGFARSAYSNAVKYALWMLPLVPYLRLVDGVEPLRYLRLRAPLSTAVLRRSGAAIALFLLVGVAGTGLRGQPVDALLHTPPGQWLTALLAVLVSPLAEEILFRGFVLCKLVERLRFVTANLLSALLFSAAHWPYWLWYHGVAYTVKEACRCC